MSYALDISGQYAPDAMGGPLTDDHVRRCLDRGVDRWMVDIAPQAEARKQIEVLARHPVEIQTFRAYEWNSLHGAVDADRKFIEETRRNLYDVQRHWLDLESQSRSLLSAMRTADAVSKSSVNIADTDWLIKQFEGVCPTGIYTSPDWWMQFMGNTEQFSYMPVWFAHWNGLDSLDMSVPFGGWTRGEMHQTLANLFVEGVWCDTNYYEKAPMPPAPNPVPAPTDDKPVNPLVAAREFLAAGLALVDGEIAKQGK